MRFEMFDRVFIDATSKYQKIRKDTYLESGQYPIIDQGQDFIGGYTNDSGAINPNSSPAIIFGDHTRVFKFVDFPFTIGADGVKVLHLRDSENYSKFFYYYLKQLKLINKGYSRHFKFLKEVKIPLPSFQDQMRIATVLEKAEGLIRQRKESLQLLDKLLRDTFLSMFGDPVRNEKGWEKTIIKKKGQVVTGNTPPRSNSEYYDSSYLEWIKTDNITDNNIYVTNAEEFLSESGSLKARVLPEGSLLVTCIAGSKSSIGRAALANRRVAFNQQINAIIPNEEINPQFLYWQFRVIRSYVQSFATKGMKRIINKSTFESIDIISPPITLQNEFASIVEKVEALKEKYKASLTELENLYGSLSQRAFKEGGLDLSKVEVEVPSPKPNPEDVLTQNRLEEGFFKKKNQISRKERSFSLDTAIDIEKIREEYETGSKVNQESKKITFWELFSGRLPAKNEAFTEEIGDYFLNHIISKKIRRFTLTELKTNLDNAKIDYKYDQLKEFLFKKLESRELLQFYASGDWILSKQDKHPSEWEHDFTGQATIHFVVTNHSNETA